MENSIFNNLKSVTIAKNVSKWKNHNKKQFFTLMLMERKQILMVTD